MSDALHRRARSTGDERLFGPDAVPALRAAVADMSWLLTRGYPGDAALKIVGDRHGLSARQRMAVLRSSCSDQARELRRARRVEVADLAGQTLAVDGLNALITVESALAHGLVLRGRDGALRDLAAVHGAYQTVLETRFAVEAIARLLHGPAQGAEISGPACVRWYLDRPVSGSGRLRALLLATAEQRGLPWEVELANHPDPLLAEHPGVVATTDAWVLDRCARWIDLLGSLLARGSAPGDGPTLAARASLWLVSLVPDADAAPSVPA